jgi:hypothetical protein
MFWLEEYSIQVLDSIADNIQKELPGVEILDMKEWYIPIYKGSVEILISNFRKVNIIEEFILKLLEMNIKEFGNVETIQDILQFDTMFINPYLKDMLAKGLIDHSEGYFRITEKGKSTCGNGLLPLQHVTETVEFYYNPILRRVYNKGSTFSSWRYLTQLKMKL